MKTNNFKELRSLIPVASAKPGSAIVKVGNSTYLSKVQVEEDWQPIVTQLVKLTYDQSQQYVNQLFYEIYRKPVKFSDRLSDLLIKIKNIMIKTGKSIEEIVTDIRSYLGYPCVFHRYNGGQLVPVSSERILKAHSLITQKASLVKVEDALYL